MNRSLLLILVLFPFATLGQSLSKLYKKVSPGVVIIETEESKLVDTGSFQGKTSVGGLGTGFLINDKQVITAAHVVQTAESIEVVFKDGEVIPGKAIAVSKAADVGLIELTWPKKEAFPLELGDSDNVEIGDQIFIIGTPLGLEYSFSSGYISGRIEGNRMENPLLQVEYFQTDAAINQGNSGGPMFNLDGEVIGIVSHILSKSGGFEGLGFAATSNIAESLLFNQNIGWSGIDGYLLEGEMAKIFNLPQPYGLLVEKVVFLSPMGIAGVQGGNYLATIDGVELIVGGDILLSINGIPISMNKELLDQIAGSLVESRKNKKVSLTVLRAGKIITLNLDLSSIR